MTMSPAPSPAADCPRLTGWRAARTDSASAFTGCINGFRSENMAKRSRFGCIDRSASAAGSVTATRTAGATSVRYRPWLISDTRATVAKRCVVRGVVAAKRADVVHGARLETEQVAALHQVGIDGVRHRPR